MRKVFVSYSHKQGAWVWKRLVPVLRAGGAEPLLDKERFKAGLGLLGQMDAAQDEADVHVLCLSTDYYGSAACQHEMQRALALDPDFMRGIVIPVRLDDAPLPAEVTAPEPLWVDMRKDTDLEPWQKLLASCSADLGTPAPTWLEARNDIVRYLGRGQSVNIRVSHYDIKWRHLLDCVSEEMQIPSIPCISLDNPATYHRHGLLVQVLAELGSTAPIRRNPHDLADFAAALEKLGKPTIIALCDFDSAIKRRFGAEFFDAIKWLTMDEKKLVLLVHSYTPFSTLVPDKHILSYLQMMEIFL